MPRTRPPYPPEFRREAIELLRTHCLSEVPANRSHGSLRRRAKGEHGLCVDTRGLLAIQALRAANA